MSSVNARTGFTKPRSSFGGVAQKQHGVPLVKKYESLATRKDYHTSSIANTSSRYSGSKYAKTGNRPSTQKGKSGSNTCKSPTNAYARAIAPTSSIAGVDNKSPYMTGQT